MSFIELDLKVTKPSSRLSAPPAGPGGAAPKASAAARAPPWPPAPSSSPSSSLSFTTPKSSRRGTGPMRGPGLAACLAASLSRRRISSASSSTSVYALPVKLVWIFATQPPLRSVRSFASTDTTNGLRFPLRHRRAVSSRWSPSS